MSHLLDTTNLQILCLLSQDKTIKEIAPIVFKSYDNVKWRIRNMKTIAKCSTNAALVMYFRNEIENVKQAS